MAEGGVYQGRCYDVEEGELKGCCCRAGAGDTAYGEQRKVRITGRGCER